MKLCISRYFQWPKAISLTCGCHANAASVARRCRVNAHQWRVSAHHCAPVPRQASCQYYVPRNSIPISNTWSSACLGSVVLLWVRFENLLSLQLEIVQTFLVVQSLYHCRVLPCTSWDFRPEGLLVRLGEAARNEDWRDGGCVIDAASQTLTGIDLSHLKHLKWTSYEDLTAFCMNKT